MAGKSAGTNACSSNLNFNTVELCVDDIFQLSSDRIDICKLFLTYVVLIDDEMVSQNAWYWICNSSGLDIERYSLDIEKLFPSVDDLKSDPISDPTSVDTGVSLQREYFLILANCLSCIASSQDDLSSVASILGCKFPILLLAIMKFLTNRLDDCISSWIDGTQSQYHYDEAIFIMSVLLALTQFCTKCGMSTGYMASKCTLGTAPSQPWDIATCSEVFDVCHTAHELITQKYQNCSVADYLKRQVDHGGNRPEDEEDLSHSNMRFKYAAVGPIQLKTFSGGVLAPQFIDASIIRVFLSLLRKLFQLSIVVNDCIVKRCLISDSSVAAAGDDHVVWRQCVLLHTEILFSLALYFHIDARELAWSQYHNSEGTAVITAILSSKSDVPLSGDRKAIVLTDAENKLITLRGYLCLRITEISLHTAAVAHDIMEAVASARLVLQCLPKFLSCVRNIEIRSESQRFTEGDDVGSSCEHVIICSTGNWSASGASSEKQAGGYVSNRGKRCVSFSGAHGDYSSEFRMARNQPAGTGLSSPFRGSLADSNLSDLRERCYFTPGITELLLNGVESGLALCDPVIQSLFFMNSDLGQHFFMIFDCLLNICNAEMSLSKVPSASSGASTSTKRKGSSPNLKSLSGVLMERITSCVLTFFADSLRNDFPNSKGVLPIFQAHVIFFFSRCLYKFPVHCIDITRKMNVCYHLLRSPLVWRTFSSGSLWASSEIGNTHVKTEGSQCNQFVLWTANETQTVSTGGALSGSEVHSYFVLRDMLLELMWSIQEKSVLLDHVNGSPPNKHNDMEMEALLCCINSSTSDAEIVQIFRWLELAICFFVEKEEEYRKPLIATSKIFCTVLSKSLSLCRYQSQSLHKFLGKVKGGGVSSGSGGSSPVKQSHGEDEVPNNPVPVGPAGNPLVVLEDSRPFFWAARSSVLDIILTIISSTPYVKWIQSFYPKGIQLPNSFPQLVSQTSSSSLSSEQSYGGDVEGHTSRLTVLGPSVQGIAQKASLSSGTEAYHSVFFYLSYDAKSRPYVNAILWDLLQKNIMYYEKCKAEGVGNEHRPSVGLDIAISLAHHIVKGMINLLKYYFSLPAWCDGSKVAFDSLYHLLRCLSGPNGRSYQYICNVQIQHSGYFSNMNHIGALEKLTLTDLYHYIICTFDDMVQCLDGDAAMVHLDSTVGNRIVYVYFNILFEMMQGDTVGQDQFYQVIMSRRDRSAATPSKNSDTFVTLKPPKSSDSKKSLSMTSKSSSSIYLYNVIVNCCVRMEKSTSFSTILSLFSFLVDSLYKFVDESVHSLFDFSCFLDPKNNESYVVTDSMVWLGLFSKRDVPVISNVSILPVLVNLIPYCEERLQLCVLRSLYSLVSGRASLINLSKVSQVYPSLLDLLLDIFISLPNSVQAVCVDTLQILGKQYISVAQLKRVFHLIQMNGTCRSSYLCHLLMALKGMISTKPKLSGPKCFFLFEGNVSGLQLPSFAKWPATRGYSFCTWFRLEATSSNSSNFGARSSSVDVRVPVSSYRPTLYSFKEASGLGIEVYFKQSLGSNSMTTYELVLRTCTGKKDVAPSVVELSNANGGIMEGHWYFLGISHIAASFLDKGEVTVLLNEHHSRHVLTYPRFSNVVCNPSIGNINSSSQALDPLAAEYSGVDTCFRGQMSSFFFFSQNLSLVQLQGIHDLGSSYSSQFDNRDAYSSIVAKTPAERSIVDNSSMESLTPNASAVLDGSLTSLIMLSFNPAIRKGKVFINNTPDKNQVKWRVVFVPTSNGLNLPSNLYSISTGFFSSSSVTAYCDTMSAHRLPATHVCATRDMRVALNCLGGIKVLLPLFAQFDRPVRTEDANQRLDFTVDTSLCVIILELIFALLQNTVENNNLMHSTGFSLLSYFLERISPKHLTEEALQALINLASSVSWNPTWQYSIYEHILFNFKLWMFTPYVIQRKLCDVLLEICECRPSSVRKFMPVQSLLDALLLRYSEVGEEVDFDQDFKYTSGEEHENDFNYTDSEASRSSFSSSISSGSSIQQQQRRPSIGSATFHSGTKKRLSLSRVTSGTGSNVPLQLFHPVTQEVTGQRLVGGELIDIRNNILHMIYLLTHTAELLTVDDVHSIMLYVFHEKCELHKIQGLKLLLRLMDHESPALGQIVLEAFVVGNHVKLLLCLHGHHRAKVRLYAAVTLCSIIQLATLIGKLKKPVQESRMFKQSSSQTTGVDISSMNLNTPPGSFSTIPGDEGLTNHSPKPSNLMETNNDIFDDLGLPQSSLTNVLLWAQDRLQSAIERDICYSETEKEAQIWVAFIALHLVMHGKTCKELCDDVDRIREVTTGDSDTSLPVKMETVGQYVQHAQGLLSLAIICVPMIFPCLLLYLRHDCISTAQRLELLVLLKISMQTPNSSDVIILIPCWQSYVFQYIAREQSRYLETERRIESGNACTVEENVVELERSKGVIETGLRMICDIQLHAIKYGCIVGPSYVVRPAEAQFLDMSKCDTPKSVEELWKGRKVGVSVLRESMSCLRCFATQGQLDMKSTGVRLLQHTLNALQKESDTVANALSDSSLTRAVRSRLLDLNLWLIASILLEFITMPTVRKSMPIQESLSMEKILDFVDENKYPKKRELSPLSEECADVHSPSASQDPLGKLKKSQSGHSLEAVDAAIGGTNTDYDIGSDGDDASQLDEVGHQAQQYMAVIWSLVDALLEMLKIGKNDQSSITNKSIALRFGVRKFIHNRKKTHDTVDSMVSPPSIDNSKKGMFGGSSGSNASLAPIKKISTDPLDRAVEGVFWIIMRVLVNIFTQGGVSVSASEEIAPYEALEHLENMTSANYEQTNSYLGFEILHVIYRIGHTLSVTTLPLSNRWVHCAVRVLSRLVHLHRYSILQSWQKTANNSKLSDSNTLELLPDFIDRLGSNGFLKTLKGSNSVDSLADVEAKVDQLFENSYVAGSKVAGCSAKTITLLAIELAFQLLDDAAGRDSNNNAEDTETDKSCEFVRNVDPKLPEAFLSWRLWVEGMDPVAIEAKKMEDIQLSSKLTEMGLHRHSQEVMGQLESLKATEAQMKQQLGAVMQDTMMSVNAIEFKRLKDYIRTLDLVRRKASLKWNSILQELANERGPWGCGVSYAISEVCWTLDMCEDNSHKRCKIIRNPRGSKHPLASANSSYSHNAGDISALMAANHDADRLDGKADLEDDKFKSGLWRDLLKYQKPSQTVEDSDEDSIADEDEVCALKEELASAVCPMVPKTSDTSFYSKLSRSGVLNTASDPEKSPMLLSCECEIIIPSSNSNAHASMGTLEITKTKISFIRSEATELAAKAMQQQTENSMNDHLWACLPFPTSSWNTYDLVDLYLRSYQLRIVGIEFFFSFRNSVFVNLNEHETAKKVHNLIRSQVKPPLLRPFCGHKPQSIVTKMVPNGSSMKLTQAWAAREITNFEYLMKLNTIAGRTYNDMGQYPVFPWILADYTSTELKLKNPKTFRDLSWSMGAQTESQRAQAVSRYNDLDSMYDPSDSCGLVPFHHGSHYSVGGFVLWYLMRMEPFTSLHIQLQDGRFDRADRLFESMAATWKSCTTNPADIKELVPEFFYCPEIFENVNDVNFGTTQAGKKLGPISLPPWAKDPHDFIYKHRQALESEYVSLNLHNWIDLVFGYKQRPPTLRGGNQATIDSCNAFFHLTYADAVDLEGLRKNDKALYGQYIKQIAEFGQTPSQLFTKPHVKRSPIHEVDIVWPIASIVRGVDSIPKNNPTIIMPHRIICHRCYEVSQAPVILIAEMGDKIISVDFMRIFGSHLWAALAPDVVPPFKIKVDVAALELSKGLDSSSGSRSSFKATGAVQKEKRVGVPFAMQGLNDDPIQYTSSSNDYQPLKLKLFVDAHTRLSRKSSKHLSSVSSVDVAAMGSDMEVRRGRAVSNASSGDTPIGSPSYQNANDLPLSIDATSAVNSPNVSPLPYHYRKRSCTPTHDTGHLSVHSSPQKHTKGFTVTAAHPTGTARSNLHGCERLSAFQLFAVLPEAKLLFSCGHWDNSFKVTGADSGRLIMSVTQHSDVVTCLALTHDYGKHWLVTGSRDCTVMVWDINVMDKEVPLASSHPLFVLHGHDDEVSTVAVNAELNIVISGSPDGTIIIHSLRDGTYCRSLSIDHIVYQSIRATESTTTANANTNGRCDVTKSSHNRVTWVGLSKESFIVAYCSDSNKLYTFSVNGHYLATKELSEKLCSFCFSEDGQVLVTGGTHCLVVFRWIRTLDMANDGPRKGLEAVLDGSSDFKHHKGRNSLFSSDDSSSTSLTPFRSPIRSLCFTKFEKHLIVGTECGEIRIFAQDSGYLRRRLQQKLAEIGIL